MNYLRSLISRYEAHKKAHTAVLKFYSLSSANQPAVELSADCYDNYRYICIDSYDEFIEFANKYNLSVCDEHKQRFHRGSCFAAIINMQECITYGWIAYREIFWIAEIDCLVNGKNSKTAILYDFYTNENQRGKGWYPKLLNSIIKLYHKSNTFMIYVYDTNLSSARGIIKAGFAYDGQFTQENIVQYLNKHGFENLGNRYCLNGLRYRYSEY